MQQSYNTPKNSGENTTIIEHSKFICYIEHIESEEEAKSFILKIKKMNSLATHNCYAYIADDKGLIQKFSDDGEPQGTAGLPMLEVLKNKKMYKAVAVVTRYFGGIKLGTGGLTRAYSGAVSECLKNIKIVAMFPSITFSVSVGYDGYNIALKCTNENVIIKNTNFDNGVSVEFLVKDIEEENFKKTIIDAFNGKAKICEIDRGYGEFNYVENN